jgi:ribosomal protein S18 acetylase RimI-like enzyme
MIPGRALALLRKRLWHSIARTQTNPALEQAQTVERMLGGTTMLLRDVRENDAEAIAQLITEFTHLTTTAAEVRQRLARSQGIEHPVLAELDGHVVGFASLRLVNYLGEDTPYAEISELFATERCRRRGIARALMAELEERARAAGASSMAVLTAADNDTAIALYRAMGFEEFSIALQKWFTEDRPYRESQE